MARAGKIERFLSQPFHVAEQFTGVPGVHVKIEDSVRGFKEILEGKHDDLPERAFFMKGTIDQVVSDAGEAEDESSKKEEESKSEEDSSEKGEAKSEEDSSEKGEAKSEEDSSEKGEAKSEQNSSEKGEAKSEEDSSEEGESEDQG